MQKLDEQGGQAGWEAEVVVVGVVVSLTTEACEEAGAVLVVELVLHDRAGWKEEQLSSMLHMRLTTALNEGSWAGDLATPRS